MKSYIYGISIFTTALIAFTIYLFNLRTTNQSGRNVVCDSIAKGSAISLNSFSTLAMNSGMDFVTLDMNIRPEGILQMGVLSSLWKNQAHQAELKSELAKLDRKKNVTGYAKAEVGFPTHFFCTVRFENGRVTKIEKSEFD